MTLKELGDLLIYLGAVAGGLSAIAFVVYRAGVRPFVRWLRTELGATRETAEAVRAEVSHNSGRSIKDVVDRTERKVDTFGHRLDDHITNHPGA